ncbi:MAG: hypothetical protein JZU55_08085, partial [Afipia sp.]|nr:hypothetical protein [Afipia sp.]
MIEGTFRPWGPLLWVVSRLEARQWPVIGCVSTEERCLAATLELYNRNLLGDLQILEAVDPPSRFTTRAEEVVAPNRAEFRRCCDGDPIQVRDLFSTDGQIVDWCRAALAAAGDSVIVDITSMPKRYFFPLLKLALGDASVSNL